MSVRRLTYPEYEAQTSSKLGGDILLRFNAPGSRFGPVEVVLVADDAQGLLDQIAAALEKSDELLAAEEST